MAESFSEKRKKIYDYIDRITNDENFNPESLTLNSICEEFNYDREEVKKILRVQNLEGDIKPINIVKKFFVPSQAQKYKKISKRYEKPFPVSDFTSLIIGFSMVSGIAYLIPAFHIPLIYFITTNIPFGFLIGMFFIVILSYIMGFSIYRLLDFLILKYDKIKEILHILYPVIGIFFILSIIFILFTHLTNNNFDNTLLIALFSISILGGLTYSTAAWYKKNKDMESS